MFRNSILLSLHIVVSGSIIIVSASITADGESKVTAPVGFVFVTEEPIYITSFL